VVEAPNTTIFCVSSNMTLVEILSGAEVALRLLQAKLILVLALLLTACAFGWAFYLQTQPAIILAAGWAVLVFLPILWSTGERHAAKHIEAKDSEPLPAGSAARPRGDGATRNPLEERHHA
jgi:hypothetical protein